MSKNLHSQLQLISQVKEEAQDEQRIKSAETPVPEMAHRAKFLTGSNQRGPAGSNNRGDPSEVQQRTGLLQCVLSPRGQPQNWVKSTEIFCLLAMDCGWSHESGFLEAGRSTSVLGWGSWKAQAWFWKDKIHLMSPSLLELN